MLLNFVFCSLEFGFFNYVLIFTSAMVLNAVVMETCGIGKMNKFCHRFYVKNDFFFRSMWVFTIDCIPNKIGFLLPIATCDLNLTTSQKGILASCAYLGIIFSSHLWGFFADTRGRRSVIFPTLLVAFFVSLASSFVQNFYQFAILRFFSGFL